MALFDETPKSLADVLGQQANTQVQQTQDAYTQKKRKLVGGLGASGRLRSGVSNYDLGDLAASEGSDISDIYSGLTNALGQIPAEDYLNQKGYGRSDQLARLVGGLSKPSSLEEALGALGMAGNVAGKFAAFL